MKKALLLCLPVCLLAACAGNQPENGKISLVFQPENGKPVKIKHTFSVNSVSNGDISTFQMLISGNASKEKNDIVLELTNDAITMNGTLQGSAVSGSAGGSDSLTGDASLVAMPVFTLLGKTFRSVHTSQLDKKEESQISNGGIAESDENKMQILLRYPKQAVKVGDSWNRELLIKSGNKMNCSAVYSLEEIQGDSATIGVKGKLSGGGDSFGNEYTITGELKGKFVVDLKSGWPLHSEIDQDFILNMGGREIPMKYTINSRVAGF